MEGLEDQPGAASVAAIITPPRFVPASFFFLNVFPFRVFFCTALAAPPRALLSAVDGEVRSWVRVPNLHPFFVKVEASVPGSVPCC